MYRFFVNIATEGKKGSDEIDDSGGCSKVSRKGRWSGIGRFRSISRARFVRWYYTNFKGSLVSDVHSGLTNDNGALEPTKSAPPFLRSPPLYTLFFAECLNQQGRTGGKNK